MLFILCEWVRSRAGKSPEAQVAPRLLVVQRAFVHMHPAIKLDAAPPSLQQGLGLGEQLF
jgi:hypothetical protein